jgi:hypothetical protein
VGNRSLVVAADAEEELNPLLTVVFPPEEGEDEGEPYGGLRPIGPLRLLGLPLLEWFIVVLTFGPLHHSRSSHKDPGKQRLSLSRYCRNFKRFGRRPRRGGYLKEFQYRRTFTFGEFPSPISQFVQAAVLYRCTHDDDRFS